MKSVLGLAIALLVTAPVGLAAEEVPGVAFVLGPKHFSVGDAIIIEHIRVGFRSGATLRLR